MKKKKSYARPKIVAVERIETRAINCMTNPRRRGKASPASCAKIMS